MCGICGYSGINQDGLIEEMLSCLIHRGPDEQGSYRDDGIVLGHRRLSIIDLDTGTQPIFNEDKSVVVVFNGEIYNYVELRNGLKLQGHRFYTDSDTEVIVHLYEEYGLEFINHIEGMYAFSLWDKRNRKLILVRDRLGIKPLYYYYREGCLVFASEIKALRMARVVRNTVNIGVLPLIFAFRFSSSAEETIFEDIKRLPPGSILIYKEGVAIVQRYWNIERSTRRPLDIAEAENRLFVLLEDAVKKRLRSDVPVGIHLSGGLDSFSLVWIMKSQRQDIPTFTLEIRNRNDEISKAKKVAEYFGLRNHSLKIDWSNYIEGLESAVSFIDEPLLCGNILLNYYIARFNKDFVKVVLCGDGADEIFAGYVHHLALYYLSKHKRLSHFLGKLPGFILNELFSYPATLGKSGEERFHSSLIGPTLWRRYLYFVTIFSPEELTSLFKHDFSRQFYLEPSSWCVSGNERPLEKIIDYELKSWLPNYMLLKLDRMSMASSVEARVPFLDHRIVEFSATLPEDFKIRFFREKYILRKLLRRYNKAWVRRQRKYPFTVPIEESTSRKNLERIKEVLYSPEFKQENVFDHSYVNNLVQQCEQAPMEVLLNKKIMALYIWELWRRNNNVQFSYG